MTVSVEDFYAPKAFLLGVGAQKAGTTWLSDYLRSRPDTNMGMTKEYRIFDSLHVPISKRFLDDRIAEALQHLTADPPLSLGGSNIFKYLDFLQNPDAYFVYFFRLIRSDPHSFLTGDITPNYCGLPVPIFQMIREKLLQYGFLPKVVFLMRDPVERCLSAVRMNLKIDGQVADAKTEERLLLSVHTSERYEIATRYDKTITALESVFSKNEIYYAFYESLFTEPTIRSLCDFLGRPYLEAQFDKMVNVSRTSNQINNTAKQTVFNHYKDVYRFITRHFPHVNLPALWTFYGDLTD